MFEYDQPNEQLAVIKVIGVGGGGGNAVDTMISNRMRGVEFVCANTDAQALERSRAQVKIQLGPGLGAGSDPEKGKGATLESIGEVEGLVEGTDMVFITAGMGGGTGTGGAPIIASKAKEAGALTVGVVTKPFDFEGTKRTQVAELGIRELKSYVDSLIVIPNQKLLTVAGRNMTLTDAFKRADEVLLHAVQGISDLVTVPGLVNVDFSDVRAIMCERGMALMGTGIATGEDRARTAAQNAIQSPLLEDFSIQGARGVLVNIVGGEDLSLYEVNEASSMIKDEAHQDALIIFGAVIDKSLTDTIKVTVIATGFEAFEKEGFKPRPTWAKRDDLDIPTHIREARKREVGPVRTRGNITPISPFAEEEDHELQIPAFIRRRGE